MVHVCYAVQFHYAVITAVTLVKVPSLHKLYHQTMNTHHQLRPPILGTFTVLYTAVFNTFLLKDGIFQEQYSITLQNDFPFSPLLATLLFVCIVFPLPLAKKGYINQPKSLCNTPMCKKALEEKKKKD